jgi:hypothetical protein
MAEIQQALQEWGTECSAGNGKVNAGIYIPETAYSLGILYEVRERIIYVETTLICLSAT